MKNLEFEFYEDMIKIYKESELQCNYRPTRFLRIINERGPLIAAKQLINKSKDTEGFLKLWKCKRLDLSLEYLILKDKYKELFTDNERRICRDRLEKYEFKI